MSSPGQSNLILRGKRGEGQVSVWERIIEQNSNKIFDTIDVRKSLQIITDIAVTGPEMSYLSVCL